MKAIWTPMGLESLQETTRFIGQQWNQDVVDLFLDRLDLRIEQLKRNPEIGPAYKHSDFRQLKIHRLVTLYYLVDGDVISLVLVWANRQNPEDLSQKLKRM